MFYKKFFFEMLEKITYHIAKFTDGLGKFMGFLFVTWPKIDIDKTMKYKKISKSKFKIVKNQTFIPTITSLDDIFFKKMILILKTMKQIIRKISLKKISQHLRFWLDLKKVFMQKTN